MSFNFIQKSAALQSHGTSAVTFAAAGAGKRNMITDVVAESDAGCDLTITGLHGGETMTVAIAAGGGFEKHWDESQALRGAENTAVVIDCSAGNYNIHAKGFVHP